MHCIFHKKNFLNFSFFFPANFSVTMLLDSNMPNSSKRHYLFEKFGAARNDGEIDEPF